MDKELTSLEIVKRWKAQIHWNKDWGWDKEIASVEKELTDAEKYKKALKIIKDKRVDMQSLTESLVFDKEVWYYNNDRLFGKKLTKKEYKILKEVFKYE